MDMLCNERGSPHIAGVKITFRSHRSQQPGTGSLMLWLERVFQSPCYSENKMPNLLTKQKVGGFIEKAKNS